MGEETSDNPFTASLLKSGFFTKMKSATPQEKKGATKYKPLRFLVAIIVVISLNILISPFINHCNFFMVLGAEAAFFILGALHYLKKNVFKNQVLFKLFVLIIALLGFLWLWICPSLK